MPEQPDPPVSPVSPAPTYVAVVLDHADGDPLDAVRAAGSAGLRWLLIGRGAGAGVAVAAAHRVLSGAEPLFGLSGLVLDALPGGNDVAPAGLPLLVGDTSDAAIERFWAERAGRGPVVPPEIVTLLASERVSTRTRAVHARRVLADDPDYRPTALGRDQLRTLRAVADRVVPQPGPTERHLDLAARVDAQLAAGRGDGWRPADNPCDVEAYRAALDQLAHLRDADGAEIDATLTRLADGAGLASSHGSDDAVLDADQLDGWFEDCRTDLARQWLAHPASMARIGYDGFANGGDDPAGQGYADVGADARDAWEPTLITLGPTRADHDGSSR